MAPSPSPEDRPPRVVAAGPPAVTGANISSATACRQEEDPILCGHCGRSASNGLSCIGMCVADSGY